MKLIIRATLGLLICVSLVVSTIAVQAGGVPIGGNVQITDAGLGEFGDADEPDVVAVGNNVYATWKDDLMATTRRSFLPDRPMVEQHGVPTSV